MEGQEKEEEARRRGGFDRHERLAPMECRVPEHFVSEEQQAATSTRTTTQFARPNVSKASTRPPHNSRTIDQGTEHRLGVAWLLLRVTSCL